MLDPWLESKGLTGASQVLAYFAVSKLGEPPVDGITDANPEGLTAAFGAWPPAVAACLQNGGLTCKVLEKGVFEKQMLEKLIWISAFMLVGARHPGATVGAVEKEYRSEVSSLIAELASVTAAERGLSFDEGMEERLCAYSRAVAHYPTAVKEASPLPLPISRGGTVGSTHSPERPSWKESQTHARSTQLGSRRLKSYR